MSTARLALVAILACACGRSGRSAPTPRDDAAAVAGDAASVSLAPLPLGMADLAAFEYRSRTGHGAFKQAREAEVKGDWAAVATACEAALAVDPQHLDAAYLLAVARAKQIQYERVVDPLATAVAGDFAKWGHASLAQPALQPFLATAIGQAWRARVEADRDAFAQMLARSVVVTSHGDLFGFDPDTKRYLRLTRTAGAVIGALAIKNIPRLAYITREKVGNETKLGVGLLDYGTGRTHRAALVDKQAIRVGFDGEYVVRVGNDWYVVVDKPAAELQRMNKKPKVSTYVTVNGTSVTRVAPQTIVTGDWDDVGLASAMRIASTRKIVTVPSPGLINGNTVERSPDGSQLALVAQLSDTCKPGDATAAAFVADTATGQARELERATKGIAIEWVDNRKLAIAGDHGVSIVDLDAGITPLPDADGLVAPRFKPKCVPEVVDEPVVSGEDAVD